MFVRIVAATGAGLALVATVYYVVLREHVLHLRDSRAEVAVAATLLAVALLSLLLAGVDAVVALVRHQRPLAAAPSLVITLVVTLLFSWVVVLSQVTAYTPHVDGPNAISELRKLTVNGRTEWVSLRGQDRTKPVVLFLSGGPGGSQLVTSRYYFEPLEQDYVIATWEQPGAAKSYFAIGSKDLTLQTYLDDGEEVAKALLEEFGTDRLYLMGESWGSALGLMMVKEHPEYYRGFIGTGQMISFLDTEIIDYDMALADARAIGDNATVEKLVQQGPPPYTTGLALKMNAYLSPLYGTMARTGQLNTSPFSTMDGPFGVEYGLLDKATFFVGLIQVLDDFYGKLYPVDLRQTSAELKVPVHIFQGRYDFNAPVSLVEDYYARLQAPSKGLVFFEHSGHNPWQSESSLFLSRVRAAFAQEARP